MTPSKNPRAAKSGYPRSTAAQRARYFLSKRHDDARHGGQARAWRRIQAHRVDEKSSLSGNGGGGGNREPVGAKEPPSARARFVGLQVARGAGELSQQRDRLKRFHFAKEFALLGSHLLGPYPVGQIGSGTQNHPDPVIEVAEQFARLGLELRSFAFALGVGRGEGANKVEFEQRVDG